jgi:hypothetical protein
VEVKEETEEHKKAREQRKREREEGQKAAKAEREERERKAKAEREERDRAAKAKMKEDKDKAMARKKEADKTFTLTVSKLEAHGLTPTDAQEGADPYVVFRYGSVELARTEDLKAALDGRVPMVRWPLTYSVRASSWQSAYPMIDITVYDSKSTTGGDAHSGLLGRCSFELELVAGADDHEQQFSVPLCEVPQGTLRHPEEQPTPASISFTLSMTHVKAPPPMSKEELEEANRAAEAEAAAEKAAAEASAAVQIQSAQRGKVGRRAAAERRRLRVPPAIEMSTSTATKEVDLPVTIKSPPTPPQLPQSPPPQPSQPPPQKEIEKPTAPKSVGFGEIGKPVLVDCLISLHNGQTTA